MSKAIVRIVDTAYGAGTALAMLAAAEIAGCKPLVVEEHRMCEDVDNGRAGYMEFFNWLATTTDDELRLLAQDIPAADRLVALGALDMKIREAAGLAIWRNL